MSYSDYIYQERLRDQVDALKADLALATAREAALREALEFYADFDNWEVPGDSQAYRRAWEVARAAL